jgi:acetyl-CoA acyltransferase 1
MEEKIKKRINHLINGIHSFSYINNNNNNNNNNFKLYNTNGNYKTDDDIVIVSALRTPICKAKRGQFKDTFPIDLLAAVLKATIDKTNIDPKLIQDIQVGTVLPPGGGATQARMAMFLAGFPEEVPIATVNRQCSSGLQAFVNIANSIKSGMIDIGIAAGVESMSQNDMMATVGELSPKIFDNPKARECLMTMGETSENVAEKFGITREEQDQMALESQEKAFKAQNEGRFKNEIIPVTTTIKDNEGNEKTIVVTKDDGVRKTTKEALAKLKPVFKEGGSTTAGNSSQMSDGAAAVLVMKRSTAKKLNLPILGIFHSFAVIGVPPSLMGIGPAYAIPLALEKAKLKKEDIDIYEINEAFASQAVYCVKKLGIPMSKVNPNGGAIALGHPLGCTGARQIATLLYELKRTNGRYGIVSMCIGTGMGAAAVFELEK